jgi:hypothetical protein
VNDAEARTVRSQSALAAKRRDRLAEILAEHHQPFVDVDPVLLWQPGSQSRLCVIRRFCLDITPAIHDSMDMRVHADPRFSISQRDCEIRRLPADPRKLNELIDRLRNPSLIFFQKDRADLFDVFRFVSIEAHGINGFLDGRQGKRLHRARRFSQLEQSLTCRVGRFVLSPKRKNTGDQDGERSTGVMPYDRHAPTAGLSSYGS